MCNTADCGEEASRHEGVDPLRVGEDVDDDPPSGRKFPSDRKRSRKLSSRSVPPPVPAAPDSPGNRRPPVSAASIGVELSPPSLRFESQPLCVAAVAEFELVNRHKKNELRVEAVHPSEDSPSFHATLTEPAVVAPGKSLTLSVVFLPRAVGETAGSLLVLTSAGGFEYLLEAHGVTSPYGVAPLLTARVIAGGAYMPQIELHNPHAEPLRILEVYTSESFLHLALPPGASDASVHDREGGLWRVEPAARQLVIAVSFSSSTPGRYRGYLHLRTDFDFISIPIEVRDLAEI